MNIRRIFKGTIMIFIVYCLIVHSQDVKTSVLSAIALWARVLIPSVFPYLVLSEYITTINLSAAPWGFVSGIFKRVFKIKACSAKAVLCGMLCGYPTGAMCAVSLYRDGHISKKEAASLVGFTNNAGPLFLISAVGTTMLGNTRDGLAIYIIQLFSAFLFGMITRKKMPSYDTEHSFHIRESKADFCEAVSKAVKITVNICGYMVATYTMMTCFNVLLKFFMPTESEMMNAVCSSLFEISAGMESLSAIEGSPALFGLICAAVSWSGLSVILQIKYVAKEITSLKDIIIPKICQAIISFFAGYMYKLKFINHVYIYQESMISEIFFIVCITIFAIYIFKQISCFKVKRT